MNVLKSSKFGGHLKKKQIHSKFIKIYDHKFQPSVKKAENVRSKIYAAELNFIYFNAQQNDHFYDYAYSP